MKLNIEFDEDKQFLVELKNYTNTLSKPSKEQLHKYEQMMKLMESIHDEIRINNPNFMPVYDSVNDFEFSTGKKYLEHVYNFMTPEKKEFDSH